MSALLRLMMTACVVAVLFYGTDALTHAVAKRAIRHAVEDAVPVAVKQQVSQSIPGIAREQVAGLVRKDLPIQP